MFLWNNELKAFRYQYYVAILSPTNFNSPLNKRLRYIVEKIIGWDKNQYIILSSSWLLSAWHRTKEQDRTKIATSRKLAGRILFKRISLRFVFLRSIISNFKINVIIINHQLKWRKLKRLKKTTTKINNKWRFSEGIQIRINLCMCRCSLDNLMGL